MTALKKSGLILILVFLILCFSAGMSALKADNVYYVNGNKLSEKEYWEYNEMRRKLREAFYPSQGEQKKRKQITKPARQQTMPVQPVQKTPFADQKKLPGAQPAWKKKEVARQQQSISVQPVQKSFHAGRKKEKTAEPARQQEIVPGFSVAGEYSFSPVSEGSKMTYEYFSEIGIPNVYVTQKCPKEGDCWPVIMNHKGRTLRRFGTKESVSAITSGRYRKSAFALIEHGRKCGKEYCTDLFVITDRGTRTAFVKDYKKYAEGKILARRISKNGNLIILTSKYIVTLTNHGNVIKTIPSPVKLTQGILRNNPDGDIAAMAVSVNNEVLISNLEEWITTDLILSRHGDREGVLSVYPESGDIVHGSVYKYVNEYNKGLYYIKGDFYGTPKFRKGWVFNSEKRNIGWDPDIHSENGEVVISSYDSSSKKKIHFTMPELMLDEIKDITPTHTYGFTKEKYFSFMAGTGVSKLSWIASSKVDKDDKTYMEVDYNISDSLFWMSQFEGRIGDTQLSLVYLQNQAEDYVAEEAEQQGGKLASEASKILFGTLDFHGLLSKSSSLRLVFEKSEIKGMADVKKYGVLTKNEVFSSEYDRYAALVMHEKGFYGGLQYEKYSMPSAVGFSDSSKFTEAYLDRELGINKISILGGYDILAYSKRYETNYHNLYFAGNMGIGVGWLSISDEIENKAKNKADKSKIDTPVTWALDGMLEVGYLWQQRIKRIKGFGYSFNLGYRVKGVYMGAGQSKDTDAEAEGLALEFSRYDVLHGPFLQLSLIF